MRELAAILLIPIFVFSLSVISSEYGTFGEEILKMISESKRASLVALSFNGEAEGVLMRKHHWAISEYPSKITQKLDNSPGLLHAKFAILDDVTIFGSMNFTDSSLFEDFNDAIIFNEECPMNYFSNVMDALWKNQTPPKMWKCIGIGEFYTSPYTDLEPIYMKILGKAKRYVLISAYAFTDMNIFGALKYLSSKGIDIKMNLDDWNKDWILKENLSGFDVKIFKERTLHHKFVIVDGKYLITGSANITESAFRKNFEIVFITKREDIITEYEAIFSLSRRW